MGNIETEGAFGFTDDSGVEDALGVGAEVGITGAGGVVGVIDGTFSEALEDLPLLLTETAAAAIAANATGIAYLPPDFINLLNNPVPAAPAVGAAEDPPLNIAPIPIPTPNPPSAVPIATGATDAAAAKYGDPLPK